MYHATGKWSPGVLAPSSLRPTSGRTRSVRPRSPGVLAPSGFAPLAYSLPPAAWATARVAPGVALLLRFFAHFLST